MKAEGVQSGTVVQTQRATPQRSLQHSMSIHISVESIQGKKRKDLIQEIQQRAKKDYIVVNQGVG
jgi:pyocin large subunit-like protein